MFRSPFCDLGIRRYPATARSSTRLSIGSPVGSPVNTQPAEDQPDNVLHAILIGAACLHCNAETGQGYPKMRRIVPQHSTPQREVQSWKEEAFRIEIGRIL